MADVSDRSSGETTRPHRVSGLARAGGLLLRGAPVRGAAAPPSVRRRRGLSTTTATTAPAAEAAPELVDFAPLGADPRFGSRPRPSTRATRIAPESSSKRRLKAHRRPARPRSSSGSGGSGSEPASPRARCRCVSTRRPCRSSSRPMPASARRARGSRSATRSRPWSGSRRSRCRTQHGSIASC